MGLGGIVDDDGEPLGCGEGDSDGLADGDDDGCGLGEGDGCGLGEPSSGLDVLTCGDGDGDGLVSGSLAAGVPTWTGITRFGCVRSGVGNGVLMPIGCAGRSVGVLG